MIKRNKFLSTLSLRRATGGHPQHQYEQKNFYPRSPCGERRYLCMYVHNLAHISIHALLAESDACKVRMSTGEVPFLSTLSLRRATVYLACVSAKANYFYPRSPCGERPGISIHSAGTTGGFLSTLSLRRATARK